ncbi:hypothetical protein SISSUDRAFT_118057 [Sistotremastrum suecicum HHB10207 ss-3]|uniref:Uncharacterized protein n=1 Tax=Sistotremastrum suecicum HHB10207 ss-3 TaxID=1314776 RepID=A0A166B1S8_9AGAM|nr:hypothetical protein SISSUDRAFT_118057 [Sistotremastrum suecicum HHB10207 ss-3]
MTASSFCQGHYCIRSCFIKLSVETRSPPRRTDNDGTLWTSHLMPFTIFLQVLTRRNSTHFCRHSALCVHTHVRMWLHCKPSGLRRPTFSSARRNSSACLSKICDYLPLLLKPCRRICIFSSAWSVSALYQFSTKVRVVLLSPVLFLGLCSHPIWMRTTTRPRTGLRRSEPRCP